LSISDEAFLLVVLDNYSERWQAEYANNIKKVSVCTCDQLARIKATLTNNLRLLS
jgi:hypothetical protein